MSINAARISGWLGGVARPLQDKYTDLNLTEARLSSVKCGASSGACACLSVAQLLGCVVKEGKVQHDFVATSQAPAAMVL